MNLFSIFYTLCIFVLLTALDSTTPLEPLEWNTKPMVQMPTPPPCECQIIRKNNLPYPTDTLPPCNCIKKKPHIPSAPTPAPYGWKVPTPPTPMPYGWVLPTQKPAPTPNQYGWVLPPQPKPTNKPLPVYSADYKSSMQKKKNEMAKILKELETKKKEPLVNI